MNRCVIVASLLVLSAAPGFAQTPNPPVPWANKFFLPDIVKNPSQPVPPVITHDFGTVPHGTLCAYRFKVTNIYDVPMQVLDIRRSCGCLSAYPPERVLKPRESDEFVVTMDTAKFTGPNAQTIYVTFWGSRGGRQFLGFAVLNIRGNSRADVSLNPGSVNFGTVAQGAKATQSAALEYTGRSRDDWKVTGVVKPSGPIDVEVRPASVLRGWLGVKYQVIVSLKPDAPAGPLSEVVTLKTNDPTAPLVQVNVTGNVVAPLSLSTKSVQFGTVKVGETVTRKILVRASAPFRIQPVGDAGDGVSVDPFPARTPVQNVTIRFQPTKPGPVRREVQLRTDLNGGATVSVTVEGVAEAPAK
jgi:hypothetical protein